MMVFNNPYNATETWTAQGAVVTWGKGNGSNASEGGSVPLIMTDLSIGYSRSMRPVFAINKVKDALTRYNIAGAPSGTLNIGSILGPTATELESFLSAVTNTCHTNNDSVLLTINPFGNVTCTSEEGESFQGVPIILRGVELVGMSMAIQGGDMALINMPLSFMFSSMEIKFK